jgi:anti-anti-sigma regulatory factor
MANVKISELPVATTPITGAELVPLVQGNVTKQTTSALLRAGKTQLVTATAGQTVFNLSSTYVVGSDVLQVFVNGLQLVKTSDYTETSSSSVTFTSGLSLGDEAVFRY